MEDFLNWLGKPLSFDDIELWFNMNNLVIEKIDLYSDFTLSLISLIEDTYLGDFNSKNITTIYLSSDEIDNHFNWCWNKIINDFAKENLIFNLDGEHKEYFSHFLKESFYYQKNEVVRKSIKVFYNSIFDYNTQYTKFDLETLTEIYKKLDKNLKLVYCE
jgi:hypothetical protein